MNVTDWHSTFVFLADSLIVMLTFYLASFFLFPTFYPNFKTLPGIIVQADAINNKDELEPKRLNIISDPHLPLYFIGGFFKRWNNNLFQPRI